MVRGQEREKPLQPSDGPTLNSMNGTGRHEHRSDPCDESAPEKSTTPKKRPQLAVPTQKAPIATNKTSARRHRGGCRPRRVRCPHSVPQNNALQWAKSHQL